MWMLNNIPDFSICLNQILNLFTENLLKPFDKDQFFFQRPGKYQRNISYDLSENFPKHR